MRVIIFGTGNIYRLNKENLKQKKVEIVVFIDNNQDLWGTKIDGIPVDMPDNIIKYEYDAVFCMSVFDADMRKQLLDLGIPNEKIVLYEDIPMVDSLAFVAIVKNEAPYIEEWIEFHKKVGVSKFYIYDNDSEDNLEEVLHKYIMSGDVVYQKYSGTAVQNKAYMDAVEKYKYLAKYMGFIDIDEFVIPVQTKTIYEEVDKLIKTDSLAAGVCINWRIYGSSHKEKKESGPVIERFLYRAKDEVLVNYHVKTICNPRMVKKINSPHYPICMGEYGVVYYNLNENGERIIGVMNKKNTCEKLRINHYFTKSKEEYMKKMQRGRADTDEHRGESDFFGMDKNDVFDDIAIQIFQRK